MTFGKFVITVCALYLFYYAGCFIYDAFFNKSKKIGNSENTSFQVDFDDNVEPDEVDEQDYNPIIEKKKIIAMPNIIINDVEHQGFEVNADLIRNLKSEASNFMKEIRL